LVAPAEVKSVECPISEKYQIQFRTEEHMKNTVTNSQNHRLYKKTALLLAGMMTVVAAATGCSAGSSPGGELGEDQQLLAQCDPAAPPASFVQIDATGSSNTDAILGERMAAIESVVRRTAVCSGYLRVIVFTASSAATAALFDGQLRLDGATDNAKLKRVPELVSSTMDQIKQAYGPAVAGLSGRGSDITAQLRLASEWIGQLGGSYQLNLYLFTDGFQNVGVDLGARALSRQEAEALANQAAVPQLSGASVVVAGLGRVAGNPPSSSVVEGLVAYYDALCRKTTAAECRAVTDYATEGR
jgi:hypothetical protein